MQIRFNVQRVKFDAKRLHTKYKAGRDKALDRVGSIVRQSAKKQLANRRPSSKPIWSRVGELDGVPLVSVSFQKPTAGKVTSWKPKRFLYSRIMYSRDDRKGSVVIGPDDKVVPVNKLHEFGGSRELKLVLIRPVPVDRLYQYEVPQKLLGASGRRRDQWVRRAAYVGMWKSTGARVRGRVVRRDPGRAPAGRYMERGLAAKRQAILPQFKNRIHGP
jgi:hypothetical protein